MKHVPADFDPAEWAALYAAGALSPEECAQFEAKLAAGDRACLDELKPFEPVVEGLLDATLPVAPPGEVRSRLLEQIGTKSEPPASPDPFVQRAAQARWREMGIPGVTRRVLWIDRERNEYSALIRCEPGTVFPSHIHPGPEQVLVLEGDLTYEAVEYGPGDYQRFERGTRHAPQSTKGGCLILITGTLGPGLS